MDILWKLSSRMIYFEGEIINVTCDVRNELNGRRKLSEPPVYSENKDGSKGEVYMPRTFPVGRWEVYTIIAKSDPYEAPEFIATNAHQTVDVWMVKDGHYYEKSGRQVEDYGYGLHNSTSSTTLGCGRISLWDHRKKLVAAIRAAWKRGEKVTLIVEE